MKPELSVIVPCFNEEKNIPELVSRLLATFKKKGIAGEIILIDDGSTDHTARAIKHQSRIHSNVISGFHEKNLGMFLAWKTGLKASNGSYICLIDADLQHQPEDVWRLFKEIKQTPSDIVQGYRSSVGRIKNSHHTLSRGLNFILNTLFRMKSKDNKSGFIVTHKSVLEDLLDFRLRYYYPQTLIAVAANAKGYSIRQIETLFESRLIGEWFITKRPFKPTVLTALDIIKGFWEFKITFKRETLLSGFLDDHKSKRSDADLSTWRKMLFNLYFWTLPLHSWMISRNTKKYYYELKRSQWLTPQEIKELQEKKLRLLVRHAYNHVGYYRQLFDEFSLKPEDISSISDLQKLPFLDKTTVRENLYFDLLSDNHDKKKILKISTSGSTGQPFVCYADQHQLEMRWAATLRSMEWTGYRFGDRQMRLWHQTLGMSFTQVLKEKLDAIISRRVFVPAYQMTDKNIIRFIKKLRKYKPVLIDGYAESFNFLSTYIKDHGLTDIYPPKGIVSSAQSLPDQSREIIEKTFNTKVFDKYGSREFSGIAYESDGHDGHLIVAENYIVEIIKDGRPAQPGEIGEVIITDLNNYCMPFLRYRVGDLAVAMNNEIPSPCGRGLPRIGKIEGRVQAIIAGTNGNYVPGTFFAHLFKDYDYAIKQYKVIQEKPGGMTLQIVKALRFDEKTFGKIISTLHEFLGNDMTIDVEFHESIPMVRTGKQQGSISRLTFDFQRLNTSLKSTK